MGDYVQIGMICPDNITNTDLVSWLENLEDSYNQNFVEVLDGDASLIRNFDCNEILTLDELLQSEYAAGCYVSINESLTDLAEIEKLDAVRERAKNFWSGNIYYKPIGN